MNPGYPLTEQLVSMQEGRDGGSGGVEGGGELEEGCVGRNRLKNLTKGNVGPADQTNYPTPWRRFNFTVHSFGKRRLKNDVNACG